MKKFIARIIRSASYRLNIFANGIAPLPTDIEPVTPHSLWVRDNGDKTLRLSYLLSQEDIVLDVGGYEGQWASDIFSQYLCTIHIFEPVPFYASLISKRFQSNKRIQLHEIGLGKVNDDIEFSIAGDASSSIVRGDQIVKARIAAFDEWYQKNHISDIALMKVNIEGGEYDLLEHLIETGLIVKVKNLQVQFHDFFPDAAERMVAIQRKLEKTHRLTYQYLFIWENWCLKDVDQ